MEIKQHISEQPVGQGRNLKKGIILRQMKMKQHTKTYRMQQK